MLIIIPAFNEEGSIGELLRNLEDQNVHKIADVLVVDDASADKTSMISKQFDVTIITHVFNLGYGSALQLGYKYAVMCGYNYVIQLDADGQHDISNIFNIYEKLLQKGEDGRQPDIVIGSRFMEGSVSFPLSSAKKAAIGVFRTAIRCISHQTVLDPTSGLQGLSRSAFQYYSKFNNFYYNYPDANMIIQMILLGFKVIEIPAVMHERTSGTSMHSGWWKPFLYMLTMSLSIVAVSIRVKTGIQKPLDLNAFQLNC